MNAMPDMTDCSMEIVLKESFDLPTRQRNILRNLLEKHEVSPEEVARLSYGVVRRAPGVGKQSIDIIRKWLYGYGLDLIGVPVTSVSRLEVRRKYKLDQAIDYLSKRGYEVKRLR